MALFLKTSVRRNVLPETLHRPPFTVLTTATPGPSRGALLWAKTAILMVLGRVCFCSKTIFSISREQSKTNRSIRPPKMKSKMRCFAVVLPPVSEFFLLNSCCWFRGVCLMDDEWMFHETSSELISSMCSQCYYKVALVTLWYWFISSTAYFPCQSYRPLLIFVFRPGVNQNHRQKKRKTSFFAHLFSSELIAFVSWNSESEKTMIFFFIRLQPYQSGSEWQNVVQWGGLEYTILLRDWESF